MAIDKRGRKLPKGIQQRYSDYEGRFMMNGKSYLVHGKTIAETQKEMRELRYKLEHGVFVEKKKVTLNDWFEIWITEYKKNRVKIGTYTNYKKYYGSMLAVPLGKKFIADIRGEHIQKLYNDLMDKGYSLSSIKVMSAILNGCMQQALRNGLIERNPVKLTELPRQTEKKTRQAMTREQQALFMKYAEESYLYNFFAVMLRTGMRNGEMRGFIYSKDVDKAAGVIRVQRTLKYESEFAYEVPEKMKVKREYENTLVATFFTDTPKTPTSLRDIPLTRDLEKYLDAQRNFWGFKVEKMDRFLFCNEIGEPLSRARIQNEINRIVERIRAAGHDFPHITPHVFRHTFATRAIEAGMQPQVLKTILGHSSLAMTMDLYSHVLPETRAEEMEKISSVF